MCSRSRCSKCHKVSYIGGGRHLKVVFAPYNRGEICACLDTPQLKMYLLQQFGTLMTSGN